MKIHNKYIAVSGILFSIMFYFPRMVFAVEKPLIQTTPSLSHGVSPGVSSGNLMQVTLGLLLILALIAGIAWLLRRYGRLQSAASGSLRIIGGLSLGPRERVVLLQAGDTQLLVGVAPGRVQMLHVLNEPLLTPEITPAPVFTGGISGNDVRSFAQRLSTAIKQRKPL